MSSKVSASSRSSSRGPPAATRAERLCSEAARAAAVMRCTGRSARPAAIHPSSADSEDDDGECDQPVREEMRQDQGLLVLGASLLLERFDALRDQRLIRVGPGKLGPAVRHDARRPAPGRLNRLPSGLLLCDQRVADRDDDGAPKPEQQAVEQGQPRSDG